MVINPADLKVKSYMEYSKWGTIVGTTATVLHVPTNISTAGSDASEWRARAKAFEALLEKLKDVPEQLELF